MLLGMYKMFLDNYLVLNRCVHVGDFSGTTFLIFWLSVLVWAQTNYICYCVLMQTGCTQKKSLKINRFVYTCHSGYLVYITG